MDQLPNAELAFYELEKIRDYLLNLEHHRGASKARFFLSLGFKREEWWQLGSSLLLHTIQGDAKFSRAVRGGDHWQVLGPLTTPSEKRPLVLSVWAIQNNGSPKLISAYPGRKNAEKS